MKNRLRALTTKYSSSPSTDSRMMTANSAGAFSSLSVPLSAERLPPSDRLLDRLWRELMW